MSLGLVRIERDTVQNRVYLLLRDQVIRGGFRPGQALKVAELAAAFGTSAMPVREALGRLSAERALESLPNRTTRVPRLSREQLEELREARAAIEGLAVTRAAEHMTPAVLGQLRAIIEAQDGIDAAHDPAASAEQNRLFHFTIYRQSGSVLLPIIESLWLQFGPYLRYASERFDGRKERDTSFHVDLLQALEARAPEAARHALETDIGRSFDLVLASQDLDLLIEGAA